MQVVPDNINITTGYHVFETPEDICINSQMYDKISMEPKPYSFFNINQCLNNKNLLLYECNILEYPWAMIAREPDYEYYIQDNQDPNIFYFITEINPTNQDQYICKAQKVENSWKILNTISPDANYTYGVYSRWNKLMGKSTRLHYKLLGQTNEYIIVAQTLSHVETGNRETWGTWNEGGPQARFQSLTYISIRKSNMSAKNLTVWSTYDYSVYKLKEEADQIYLFENWASGDICVVRLDPNTNTRLEFFNKSGLHSYITGSSDNRRGRRTIGISNIILFKNKYYVMTNRGTDNLDGYAFQQLTINFNNNTVSCTQINIPSITGIPYHIGNTIFYDSHLLQIDLKNINDTYIAITIHDKRNFYHGYDSNPWNGYSDSSWSETDYANTMNAKLAQTVSSAQGWHRHALLKWQNNSFVSKGIISPDESNQHIYGVLYYDQYTPIFFMNKRIIGYKLNTSTDTYSKCFEVAGTFNTIGIDENKKFYTFDNSNVCHIYNDVTSYLLDAQFEKTSYNYANTNISSYVRIYSKNFLNNYIQTKVKVMIEGNCRFTENNKKEIITYTNASGTKDIPVTITAGGTMYCYIKEVD